MAQGFAPPVTFTHNPVDQASRHRDVGRYFLQEGHELVNHACITSLLLGPCLLLCTPYSIVRLTPTTVGGHHGASVLATSGEVAVFLISVNMVSSGGLDLGREIRLGALVFIVDDSTWLQEAPLNVEALPIRGLAQFRASACGVLLRQPSTQYRSAPSSSTLPAVRHCKRSSRSWLQRWVKHAVARQSATPKLRQSSPTNPYTV